MSSKVSINRTHFIEKGKGIPVILIHGVGLDNSIFRYQIDFLSKYFRVIAYDMIGHGKSEKPEGKYELVDYAEQLKNLMENLNIEKANIVGFSMGAMVSQLFAILYPEKVLSLSLLSAVANRDNSQQQNVLKRVKQVKDNGHLSTVDAAIERWFSSEFSLSNKELVNEIKDILKRNDSEAYLKSYSLFAVSDLRLWPLLSKINSPTFIITGENDIGSNPDMARKMGEKIPNSQVVIVPNIKHMLPIEGAEELNNYLLSFLNVHN